MKFSGKFWYTTMIPEFIVGDWKLQSISGWICSNYSSGIVFSTASSNTSSYSYLSLVCSLFALARWVASLLLSIVLMWSYGSTKWTEFALCVWSTNMALEVPDLDLSILLLKSLGIDPCLWFFCSICSIAALLWIKKDLWKGMFKISHHATSIIISLNCCQVHIHQFFF